MGERSTCWLSADTLDREAPGLPSGVAHLFPQVQIWRWLPVAQWLGPLAIFSVKGSESHTPAPELAGWRRPAAHPRRVSSGPAQGAGLWGLFLPTHPRGTGLIAWARGWAMPSMLRLPSEPLRLAQGLPGRKAVESHLLSPQVRIPPGIEPATWARTGMLSSHAKGRRPSGQGSGKGTGGGGWCSPPTLDMGGQARPALTSSCPAAG